MRISGGSSDECSSDRLSFSAEESLALSPPLRIVPNPACAVAPITGKYPLPAGPSSQDFTVTLFFALRPLAFCSLLLATPSIATEQPPAAETAQAEIPDGFSLESAGTTLVQVTTGLRSREENTSEL